MVYLLIMIGVLLTPSLAYAWGPITHLYYGMEVLDKLPMLLLPLQELLRTFPKDYLYGCLAADITLKKDLVDYTEHCHNWDIGLALLDKAETPPQKAFAWGYLTHLAADTISHNYFVPYFTVASYETTVLRHIYWELRFDATRDPKLWQMTKDLTRDYNKSHHDELLKTNLKRTLFSFTTNKVIFNRIMSLSQSKKWHGLVSAVHKKSTWALSPQDVKEFQSMAIQAIFDFLNLQKESKYYLIDPSGKLALDKAKRLRKELKKLSKTEPKDKLQKRVIEIRREFKAELFLKPKHQKWVKVQ